MKRFHDDAVFRDAFAVVSTLVHSRYGVAVLVGEVSEPYKGDLDGAEIVIGTGNDAESRVFLLAHLFGHTVQWNTSEAKRRLGMKMPIRPDEHRLRELEDYEREACSYSQQLMHEAGVQGLDQWLADYAACDHAYLAHLYLTGERRSFHRFWRDGCPLLQPLSIPRFVPKRWRRRGRAIVV